MWWTAAPNLTPVAAWDSQAFNGTTFLDRVGTNGLVVTNGSPVLREYPVNEIAGGVCTRLETPIAFTGDWVWCALMRITGDCQLIWQDPNYYFLDQSGTWYQNGAAGNGGAFGSGNLRGDLVFLALTSLGKIYVNGSLYRTVDITYFPNAMAGCCRPDNQPTAIISAIGVFTGNATDTDIQLLEVAARSAMAYSRPSVSRSFASGIGRMEFPIPQHLLLTPIPPRFVGSTLTRRDYQFGGNGRIAGTVKEKGAPDTPLQRRVQLYDETSKIMTREVWSDPTTGAYLFENIDPTLTYTVISYDYTGMYRAVIANGQKAST